jgi:hypothetical protein
MGNLREALKVFKRIHNKYPDNREALTFLIATCRDIGIPYDEYNQKLNKLEREVEFVNFSKYHLRMNMTTIIIQIQSMLIILWVIIRAKMVKYFNLVDFRQYAFKSNHVSQPKTSSSKFLQFEHSPEELLP